MYLVWFIAGPYSSARASLLKCFNKNALLLIVCQLNLIQQIAECTTECGGAENCENLDSIDQWVARSGCPIFCNSVRIIL